MVLMWSRSRLVGRQHHVYEQHWQFVRESEVTVEATAYDGNRDIGSQGRDWLQDPSRRFLRHAAVPPIQEQDRDILFVY
jgi:hypothetical protein